MIIYFANSQTQLSESYPLIAQLRPHLTLDSFLTHVARMQRDSGYQLVCLSVDGSIKAAAGIRSAEWLHTGKYLEIEDLITNADDRSQGYGSHLFDWICQYAKKIGCNQVRLVSGVQRERAHQFYLNKGMTFEAKYFSINL